MDSRDFLFPLKPIVLFKLSSLLVGKDQPETAWYLLTPSTKERFTARRRSTLASNRETKGNLLPAIVGLTPFYQHQRNSRFHKRSEGIAVENVLQQIDLMVDLIDQPKITVWSSHKFWQLIFESPLRIFKKYQDIKTILMPYLDDKFCHEVYDAFCGPTGLSIVAEFDKQGDVTEWSKLLINIVSNSCF